MRRQSTKKENPQEHLLLRVDSNLDKQNQNLLCYHYTIVQTSGAFC